MSKNYRPTHCNFIYDVLLQKTKVQFKLVIATRIYTIYTKRNTALFNNITTAVVRNDKNIITNRVRSMTGGYVFSLFTPGGGGLPHLHPITLPLVPCPLWEVPQWLVPGPFWGIPQSLVPQLFQGVPWPSLDWGVCCFYCNITSCFISKTNNSWIRGVEFAFAYELQCKLRKCKSSHPMDGVPPPHWPGIGYPPPPIQRWGNPPPPPG